MTNSLRHFGLIAAVAVAAACACPRADGDGLELKAFHRSGQTFVTWKEDDSLKGEQYHVLVSPTPLAAGNLAGAKVAAKVMEKSGQFRVIANQETLLYKEFMQRWPWLAGLWIEDVDKGGKPLAVGTGLYVRTAKQDGRIYLAVQEVSDGKPVRAQVLDGPIEEKAGPPAATRMAGPDRDDEEGGWYVLYMDFDAWNPDGVDDNWESTGYPFQVGCLKKDLGKPMPCVTRLHAYGAYQDADWALHYPRFNWHTPEHPGGVVQVCPIDQHLTWWYGYNDALPERAKNSREPAPGKLVVNFTEQQVLAVLDWLKRGPPNFPGRIDPAQISVWGGSMGGSGTNVFGMRHGEVFAGAQSIAGYTSWALPPRFNVWYDNAVAKWGGYDVDPMTNEGKPVYEVLNMPKFFLDNPAKETPYIDLAQGSTDGVIPFESFPDFLRALEKTKRPYTASWGIYGHGGRSSAPMDFRMVRKDESLPAFGNASCNSPLHSGYRILMMGEKEPENVTLTATTLTIKPGSIPQNRTNFQENGSFPKDLAGWRLVLSPTPETRTWWTVKSNTAAELTIEQGDLLQYEPKITDYTMEYWKKTTNNPNPTPEQLAAFREHEKRRFAVLDADPFGTWNGYLAWSSSQQNFDPKSTGDDIVDEPGRWAVCIRLVKNSTLGEWKEDTVTVDVTARQAQRFKPAPGERVHWVNLDCSTPAQPKQLAEDDATADELGLVTVPKFVVGKTGWGNRLVLTRSAGR